MGASNPTRSLHFFSVLVHHSYLYTYSSLPFAVSHYSPLKIAEVYVFDGGHWFQGSLDDPEGERAGAVIIIMELLNRIIVLFEQNES